MSGDMVRIQAKDGSGSFEAYLAAPKGGKGPGLIILPEIYNSNHWVREVADGYAERGFVCLAPDVYWRQQPGVYLQYNPEDQKRGRDLHAKFDHAKFGEDLQSGVDWLRARPDCNGKVGAVGYCLGGKLVYLGMAWHIIDAGSAYYAVQLDQFYEEAKKIDGPMTMHFGSLDYRVPPEMYRTLCEKLAHDKLCEMYWYEGADHGFNRFGYAPYHPEAAKLALDRTLAQFATHLGTWKA